VYNEFNADNATLNDRAIAGVDGASAVGANTRSGTPTASDASHDMQIGNQGGSLSAVAFKGAMRELVFYSSDQTSNRTGIETNINDQYAIYGQSPTGFLADYPGAAAAYSLRQLISTANYAVAVRRASDDAVLHIGFVDGELDTDTLADFCSGTDGFVSVWFDQSGEGNHATQTTTTQQPKIYDSSTGVVTENGKPAVQFDGSNDTLKSSNFASLIGAPNFFSAVISFDDTANQYFIDSDSPGRTATGIVSGNYTVRGLNGGTAATGQHLFSVSQRSVGAELFVDDNSKLTNGSSTLVTHTNIVISDNALYFDGAFQELILWDSDQYSNRTNIETNINDFYSIF
jgi:hypothetical protein